MHCCNTRIWWSGEAMKRWSTLLHRYCLKYGGPISWQDQWITLNDIISESIHTIFTLRCKKVGWEGIRRHEGMIFPINFTDKGPFVIDIIRGLKTNKNHIRISASKSSIRRFVITEKAPARAFSWLKAATTAFTFKTLLRHYTKQAFTPR